MLELKTDHQIARLDKEPMIEDSNELPTESEKRITELREKLEQFVLDIMEIHQCIVPLNAIASNRGENYKFCVRKIITDFEKLIESIKGKLPEIREERVVLATDAEKLEHLKNSNLYPVVELDLKKQLVSQKDTTSLNSILNFDSDCYITQDVLEELENIFKIILVDIRLFLTTEGLISSIGPKTSMIIKKYSRPSS